MRDLANNIGVAAALEPAVLAATTNGAAIDLIGFGSAVLVLNTGAIAGAGNFTAKLQESDDGENFNDVDPYHLVGAFPDKLAASAIVKVGYRGFRRHVRIAVTKNGGTSIAISAVVIKGSAAQRPVI
ncbi:hypothetical protein FF124_18115 [Martelella lutilitoris]|uniref:Uncharacterized protein n=1 Tax=Martelella lutilitoris TaxID=2583532 RepID=A0A5C4JM98_9HYPH|nr:hypothetical protein [Martelella lutilitoris]TNB46437.1 hypothetical protein FF124_18115 [Martelella lutilitoris]